MQQLYRGAKRVMEALEQAGYQCFLVGGYVRDKAMGREPDLHPCDIDLATSALPEVVVKISHDHGWKAIPTGLDFGTITIMNGYGKYEITTMRREVSHHGRHPVVQFTDRLDLDAERRDFTINALYEDVRGKTIDPTGGLVDIASRTLRFVGDPSERILEDPLRILRLFRFAATLDFRPNEPALAAVARLSPELASLSRERIKTELVKLFAGPWAPDVATEMVSMGLMTHALAESQIPGLNELEQLVKLPPDLRFLAVLALGCSLDLRELVQDLKLSGAEARQVRAMALRPAEDPVAMAGVWSKVASALADEDHPSVMGVIWGARGESPVLIQKALLQEKTFAHRRSAPLPFSKQDLEAWCPSLKGKAFGRVYENLRLSFWAGQYASRSEAKSRALSL